MGVTALRLARFGCRNRPFYRLVAIDSRKRRQAMPIEYLGSYDPLPGKLDGVKEVRMRVDRIKYWLGVGAQPSGRVAYLLWRAGLMPPPPVPYSPDAWRPRAELAEEAKARKAAGQAAPASGGGGGGAGAKAAAGGGKKKFSTLAEGGRGGSGAVRSSAAAAVGVAAFARAAPRLGLFAALLR